MSENDVPYVLPMNFALDGDVVILHSDQSGRMWETLHKNPKVCINWTLGEELAWQDVARGVQLPGKIQIGPGGRNWLNL
jgi:uncharacterized protein